jgi:hypothetical protein
MKMSFGDFNAKVGRENIFKSTIGNGTLYELSHDNGVRAVNFATSKVPTSLIFPNLLGHFLMERDTIKLTIFW